MAEGDWQRGDYCPCGTPCGQESPESQNRFGEPSGPLCDCGCHNGNSCDNGEFWAARREAERSAK